MLGTQLLPRELLSSGASKGLRLRPDVSRIGCEKQAYDAGAAHVEAERQAIRAPPKDYVSGAAHIRL